MSEEENLSANSLIEATRSRASFSGHGNALGAAGHREVSFDPENCEYLREPGQNLSVSPGPEGFKSILIGVEWSHLEVQRKGLLGKILKTKKDIHVDIDIGCMYEMQDGTRGCIQAFGHKFGAFDSAPYIGLSGDERTGKTEGHDEYMLVNGAYWDQIKRVLVYLYIYKGVPNWAKINPKIIVDRPGDDDLVLTLGVKNDHLALCAVGGLENVRGGIKLTNYTEYFPGHAEMDRAFGFGLNWADGKKD
jgi:tellurite resistance protein TerA